MIYISELQKHLLNFAEDHTITTAERTIEKLISTLETQSQATIEGFKLNEMIVSPEKCQAIVVKKMLK